MQEYKYLIIGGGMTAAAAIEEIRNEDPRGSIGLVSRAHYPPYDRPPLSKGLWQETPTEEIWRESSQYENVDLHLGREISDIDPAGKQAIDDEELSYRFDQLLLATGGSPLLLPIYPTGVDDPRVIYFRDLGDYWKLRELTEKHKRFAVIGGGFIGSEIAAALAMVDEDLDVTMIFPEQYIGANRFPEDMASHLTDHYESQGVDIRSNYVINNMDLSNNQEITITLKSVDDPSPEFDQMRVEAVVVGIGIEPNARLAAESGLKVDDGILVDSYLRTSNQNIYAAGDVARFYNRKLDKWMRVEHENNANTMGKIAGRNMAGALVEHDELPFFYSDLFDYGYEAVGELDASSLNTQTEWHKQYEEGIIYYLGDEDEVRGVLLWNVWGAVDGARDLISEPYQQGEMIQMEGEEV